MCLGSTAGSKNATCKFVGILLILVLEVSARTYMFCVIEVN